MSSQDALDIHQTDLLSDVTLSALQLHQQPFGPVAPDAPTFGDDTSAEQLADVKQALIAGDNLLLILGENGAGKSILLNQLGTHSGPRIQCFAVKGSPRFSTLNLFAGMLEAFKQKAPEKLKDILDELIPCLQTMLARDTLSAIVLDDADQISESELTQLLSGMLYINGQETNGQVETLMRVALAAPPEFEDRIPDLLPEGADMPYSSLTIEGMNDARAAEYLAFRLHAAGYASEPPFAGDQISEMVSHSGGFPASLHIEAAAILNQQYDPAAMDLHVNDEFSLAKTEPFLQSRKGKFGLGLLATALILIGLTMFVPDAADDQERYGSSDNTLDQDSLTEATPLRIVEEKKRVPLPQEDIEPPAVQSPPDAAQDSEEADSTDVAINDTNSAAEGSPQEADSAIVPDSDNSQTVDTAGENPTRAADTDTAAVDEDSATLPASDTVSADVENPPIIIVPESADVAESTDSVDPVTEPDSSSEPASAESDDIDTAGEPSSNAPTDGLAEQVPVIDSTPDVNPAVADILESPTWILVQDPAQITVQMSASRDQQSIESFLQRNRAALPPPNSIYSFQRNGETWYALLHGLFSSFDAAQTAVEQMPERALSDQPWIRNVGRIQTVLKAQ